MPINKRYPIEDLVAFAVLYNKTERRMITFEYVVIENENDTVEAADTLMHTLKKVRCKINLIHLNDSKNCKTIGVKKNHFKKRETQGSSEERMNNFAGMLSERGLTVSVRKSRGRDIGGACGQLAGKVKKIDFKQD